MKSTTSTVGVGADWSYTCLAVYGEPRADDVRRQLTSRGMVVLEDHGEISSAVPGATVLHALRATTRIGPEGRQRITARLAEVGSAILTALVLPYRPIGDATFQPVWWTSPLQPLHLEILVVDSDNADRQLHLVAQGLGVRRQHVELVPRWGWSGYGSRRP